MTAVLLIATMLDSKISSLVWSYRFGLLPFHRTNTVGTFHPPFVVSCMCCTGVEYRTFTYNFQILVTVFGAAFTVFHELRSCLPELHLWFFVSCVCVFQSCFQDFHSCVYAYRSCVCSTVTAQQRKWFPKRNIIFKDVYRNRSALLWLKVEILKRSPTPSFGTLS